MVKTIPCTKKVTVAVECELFKSDNITARVLQDRFPGPTIFNNESFFHPQHRYRGANTLATPEKNEAIYSAAKLNI